MTTTRTEENNIKDLKSLLEMSASKLISLNFSPSFRLESNSHHSVVPWQLYSEQTDNELK